MPRVSINISIPTQKKKDEIQKKAANRDLSVSEVLLQVFDQLPDVPVELVEEVSIDRDV